MSPTTSPIVTPSPTNNPIISPIINITCPPCEACEFQTTQQTELEPCPTFHHDCSICPTIEPEPCPTITTITEEPCPTFECPKCPIISTPEPEPCPTLTTPESVFPFTTAMCPPCTTQQDETFATTQQNTTNCPKCEICEECSPCRNYTNPPTLLPETSESGPCPTTETIIISPNITCPPNPPCPTLAIDLPDEPSMEPTIIPTSQPSQEPTTDPTNAPLDTIVITDCEQCYYECIEWFPPSTTSLPTTNAPSIAPSARPIVTVRPSITMTDEPKITTDYSYVDHIMFVFLFLIDTFSILCINPRII